MQTTTPQAFTSKHKAPASLGAILLANVGRSTIKKAAAPRLNAPRAPIKTPGAPARTPPEQTMVTYTRRPAQVDQFEQQRIDQHLATAAAHDKLLAAVKLALNPQTNASTAPRSI